MEREAAQVPPPTPPPPPLGALHTGTNIRGFLPPLWFQAIVVWVVGAVLVVVDVKKVAVDLGYARPMDPRAEAATEMERRPALLPAPPGGGGCLEAWAFLDGRLPKTGLAHASVLFAGGEAAGANV